MKVYDLIVVGGGAAGLIAAISAARGGANTAILEKQKRVGKKLLLTGNGRGNYTNIDVKAADYNINSRDLVESVLARFGQKDLLDFFHRLGIEPLIQPHGRIFPRSQQAASLLNALRFEMKRMNVSEICNSAVSNITKEKNFIITTRDGKKYKSKQVIIATGGNATPYDSNANTDYQLAKKFGHNIVKPFPALVQLKLALKFLHQISGVKIPGKISIKFNDQIISFKGELQFTNYGISGIPALQISRFIKNFKKRHFLILDLEPDKNESELFNNLQKRFQTLYYKKAGQALEGFINKRLIRAILDESHVDYGLSCRDISAAEVKNVVSTLKNWKLECTGKLGWKKAQVTAGGVSINEIDKQTMESKREPGLFFAGEVVDVDGKSGGFNLQWAWSSGFIAGIEATV